jgi:hypothetical protein
MWNWLFLAFRYPMKSVFVICLATVVALLMGGCNREHEQYLEGQGQAERDLAKGELKVAISDGSNMPAFAEYTELLRKRYRVGWCVSTEPWVRGYNEIASPRIKQEIGTQILKQTMTEAQTSHDATTAKH